MKRGIILALDGRNARSPSPNDSAIDSNLATLNLKADLVNPNQGVINITFQSQAITPGTNILLFRKVLDPSYPQFYYFGFNQTKSSKLLSAQYGNKWAFDILSGRYFQAKKIDNVVEFRFIVESFYSYIAGDELNGYSFQFQFAFFLNKVV